MQETVGQRHKSVPGHPWHGRGARCQVTGQAGRRGRPDQGLVLTLTLLMLLAATLLAVWALKSNLVEEWIAGNRRGMELSRQAAEVALRICEAGVKADDPAGYGFVSQAEIGPDGNGRYFWESAANWEGPQVNTLTADFIAAVLISMPTADPSRTYFLSLNANFPQILPSALAAPPKCLIERLRFPSRVNSEINVAYRLTVRAVGSTPGSFSMLQSEYAVLWR